MDNDADTEAGESSTTGGAVPFAGRRVRRWVLKLRATIPAFSFLMDLKVEEGGVAKRRFYVRRTKSH